MDRVSDDPARMIQLPLSQAFAGEPAEVGPTLPPGEPTGPSGGRAQLRAGLSRLFGDLPEAELRDVEGRLRWFRLRRGERLVEQGDVCDRVWIVVAGRLRAVREDPEPRVLGDILPGETVGEMAFFTGAPRSASVYATRESLLVSFEREVFEETLARHPQAFSAVARLLVERYTRSIGTPPAAPAVHIALVAVGEGVDLAALAAGLATELSGFGSTLHLSPARLASLLGEPDAAPWDAGQPGGARLLGWLAEQEAHRRFVLYEADPREEAWCRMSLGQADQVVIVARAGGDPALLDGLLEAIPAQDPCTAPRRVLVLIHPPAAALPVGTRGWTEGRGFAEHHHLRGIGAGEIRRLARFVAGRAVGVVLGGGGARGFAHIGVLRALREAGIPVDLIGGASMGASMAAQHAMGWTHEQMQRNNRRTWIDLRPHREYTLPLLSLLRGLRAGRMADILYGTVEIEDLWTPFFCVSSNLTQASVRVHRGGSLLRAATASASLPGVVVPVLDGGDLLVDGGVLNNLPVDVMREMGAGIVILVDVSGEDRLTCDVESFPSPWLVLRDRLLGRARVAVPGILEVLVRSSLLASTGHANSVRGLADYRIAPSLEEIGLMEFEALDRAAEIGYRDAREAIASWTGVLMELPGTATPPN
jgi:predicted acylesterase/phospholipase RssA/CRP-like cAMP-binding protein